MWQALLVTISTSAFDSLNPMAIGQQFVLQGLVKKPRDIWYFILTTGFINFLGGVLFYFSLSDILIQLWHQIKASVTPYLSIITLIGAVGLILYLIRYFWLIRRTKEEVKVTIKGSVSPLALVLLGIGATISELATALPYFAFIGWLMNQSFSYWTVIGLMVIYNLIYELAENTRDFSRVDELASVEAQYFTVSINRHILFFSKGLSFDLIAYMQIHML